MSDSYPSLLRATSVTHKTKQGLQRIYDVGEAQGVKVMLALQKRHPHSMWVLIAVDWSNICYILMGGISHDFLNENAILFIWPIKAIRHSATSWPNVRVWVKEVYVMEIKDPGVLLKQETPVTAKEEITKKSRVLSYSRQILLSWCFWDFCW